MKIKIYDTSRESGRDGGAAVCETARCRSGHGPALRLAPEAGDLQHFFAHIHIK